MRRKTKLASLLRFRAEGSGDSTRVNRKALGSAVAALALPILVVLDRLIVSRDKGVSIGFGILLTLAFALGVVALRDIRRTDERGKTLAVIGITAPSAYLAFFLVVWIGLR